MEYSSINHCLWGVREALKNPTGHSVLADSTLTSLLYGIDKRQLNIFCLFISSVSLEYIFRDVHVRAIDDTALNEVIVHIVKLTTHWGQISSPFSLTWKNVPAYYPIMKVN